jgi:hypothetical protein
VTGAPPSASAEDAAALDGPRTAAAIAELAELYAEQAALATRIQELQAALATAAPARLVPRTPPADRPPVVVDLRQAQGRRHAAGLVTFAEPLGVLTDPQESNTRDGWTLRMSRADLCPGVTVTGTPPVEVAAAVTDPAGVAIVYLFAAARHSRRPRGVTRTQLYPLTAHDIQGVPWGCSLAAAAPEDPLEDPLPLVRRWHSFGLCQDAYRAADPEVLDACQLHVALGLHPLDVLALLAAGHRNTDALFALSGADYEQRVRAARRLVTPALDLDAPVPARPFHYGYDLNEDVRTAGPRPARPRRDLVQRGVSSLMVRGVTMWHAGDASGAA